MQEVGRRRSNTTAAVLVVALGLGLGLAAARSTNPTAPADVVVGATVLASWSFAFAGAAVSTRYRTGLIGSVAVAAGLAIVAPTMKWIPTAITWTTGSVLTDVHLVVLAWLVLAFPTGRLDQLERRFVAVVVAYFLVLNVSGHLFQVPAPGCESCPESLLLVRVDDALSDRIWAWGQVGNLIIVGVLVALIVRKVRAATPAGRRAISPVVWALGPIGLVLVAAFVEPLAGGTDGSLGVLLAERLALIVFPGALVAGALRARLDQARVADLTMGFGTAPTSAELAEGIATALGDPTARIAFPTQGGLIDIDGRAAARSGASVPVTDDAGSVIGYILHDPAVDPALSSAVAAAASLAIRNERLRAELRRRIIEVEMSRERIAEAAFTERRRIERDLHDGAQQGLLALGASLGAIRTRSEGDVVDMVDEAIRDLRSTLDDLRALARGVHPALLTDRGLAAAIRALAERAPVPVEADVVEGRFRESVEAAAYFFVAECAANAFRHAAATHVGVSVSVEGDALRVEVSDDGIGGADPAGGSGLQGLVDRVDALGGSVRLSSPPGGGSTVTAVLPCG